MCLPSSTTFTKSASSTAATCLLVSEALAGPLLTVTPAEDVSPLLVEVAPDGAAALSAGLPYGIARLLAGLVFCVGLILVIVGGAELFTGNTLIVMALAISCSSSRAGP